MQEFSYMSMQSNYAKSHVQSEVYPKKKLGQHRGSQGAETLFFESNQS